LYEKADKLGIGKLRGQAKDRSRVFIGEETIVSRGSVKVVYEDAVVVDTLSSRKILSHVMVGSDLRGETWMKERWRS
jgi:hypothetical protein